MVLFCGKFSFLRMQDVAITFLLAKRKFARNLYIDLVESHALSVS